RALSTEAAGVARVVLPAAAPTAGVATQPQEEDEEQEQEEQDRPGRDLDPCSPVGGGIPCRPSMMRGAVPATPRSTLPPGGRLGTRARVAVLDLADQPVGQDALDAVAGGDAQL